MPIRFTYNSEVKILFTTAEGVISFEELQAHLNGEWLAQRVGSREFVDASKASTSLTSQEAKEIVASLLQTASEQEFGPTAIVERQCIVRDGEHGRNTFRAAGRTGNRRFSQRQRRPGLALRLRALKMPRP